MSQQALPCTPPPPQKKKVEEGCLVPPNFYLKKRGNFVGDIKSKSL